MKRCRSCGLPVNGSLFGQSCAGCANLGPSQGTDVAVQGSDRTVVQRRALTRYDSPCTYCGGPLERSVVDRLGAPFCAECERDRLDAFAALHPIPTPTDEEIAEWLLKDVKW